MLDDYQHLIREYVRRRHGVYALYRRDKLYYVGLARDLRSRLKTHLKDRHARLWDRFSIYLTITDSHVKELESLLLRIVQPKGNRAGGGFAKAQNLKQVLGKRIRDHQRAQLDQLMGRRRRAKAGRVPRISKTSGAAIPVLAAYKSRPKFLRGRYKGKRYVARVLRDGSISYAGTAYRSPSMAAKAATKRKNFNGWYFWTYERAPGEWVRLRELRK